MWFTETSWPPIVAFLVATVFLAFLWSRSRRTLFAVLAGLCLLLTPVVYLVEQAVVTPAEEVERLVHELRDAVAASDVERTLTFLSESALAERGVVATALTLADVHEDVRVTDLSVGTLAEDSQALSHFRANGTVSSRAFGEYRAATRWELSWRKEAGAWKIYKIVRLNPITGEPIGMLSAD